MKSFMMYLNLLNSRKSKQKCVKSNLGVYFVKFKAHEYYKIFLRGALCLGMQLAI